MTVWGTTPEATPNAREYLCFRDHASLESPEVESGVRASGTPTTGAREQEVPLTHRSFVWAVKYLRLTSPHANMYGKSGLARQTVKMWGAFLDTRRVFTRISREGARM